MWPFKAKEKNKFEAALEEMAASVILMEKCSGAPMGKRAIYITPAGDEFVINMFKRKHKCVLTFTDVDDN